MVRAIIIGIVISSSFVLVSACEEKQDPKQLTKAEKYTADTIFNNMKNSLYKEMDTLCMTKFDSIYNLALDSIKAERLLEIESLLGGR